MEGLTHDQDRGLHFEGGLLGESQRSLGEFQVKKGRNRVVFDLPKRRLRI